MTSVRDLTQLNHNLRKALWTGLSTHASPFDGNLWPILYLAVKILRHHDALVLLAGQSSTDLLQNCLARKIEISHE